MSQISLAHITEIKASIPWPMSQFYGKNDIPSLYLECMPLLNAFTHAKCTCGHYAHLAMLLNKQYTQEAIS